MSGAIRRSEAEFVPHWGSNANTGGNSLERQKRFVIFDPSLFAPSLFAKPFNLFHFIFWG